MKHKPEKKQATKPATEDKKLKFELSRLHEQLDQRSNRLAILDARLGVGVGAKQERERNHRKISALREQISRLTEGGAS